MSHFEIIHIPKKGKKITINSTLANASQFIIAHNHPSGSLKPSMEDYRITKIIKEASEIMQIIFVDHLIITANGFKNIEM